MKFNKYTSIENSYREAEVQKIRDNVNPDEQWVVLEKVHGSNLSILTDGKDVQVAKRTQVLGEGANFYDSDKILDIYSNRAKELFNQLSKQVEGVGLPLDQIQIFGEHFGGLYNGKTDKGYKKIQKEVQYIPFTDFIVYDIRLFVQDEIAYLDWDWVKTLCNKYGFKTVPEIFRGSFEDCLKVPNDYATLVPELYGLEDIEGNITEGNVIKTVYDIRIGRLEERAILKDKNEKFKEKGKVKSKNKNTEITPEQQKWVQEISKYFEPARIDALFSKGEVEKDWKQFGKISGLFFKDVIEDFLKDNPEYQEQDKKVKKYIQNLAQNEAKLYLREILKREI